MKQKSLKIYNAIEKNQCFYQTTAAAFKKAFLNK